MNSTEFLIRTGIVSGIAIPTIRYFIGHYSQMKAERDAAIQANRELQIQTQTTNLRLLVETLERELSKHKTSLVETQVKLAETNGKLQVALEQSVATSKAMQGYVATTHERLSASEESAKQIKVIAEAIVKSGKVTWNKDG